jgi:hypothetical protein
MSTVIEIVIACWKDIDIEIERIELERELFERDRRWNEDEAVASSPP